MHGRFGNTIRGRGRRLAARGLCLLLSAVAPFSCAAPPNGLTGPGPAEPFQTPFALVDSQAILTHSALPLLVEAAGEQVLQELALDLLLRREIADRGLRITPAAIGVERQRLVDSLAPGNADSAERLLEEFRTARNLKDRRFALLLERHAMLTALVGEPDPPSHAELQAAVQQLAAPRYTVDVEVDGEPIGRFDVTAADPSLPVSLLEQLPSLASGERTRPSAKDGRVYSARLVSVQTPLQDAAATDLARSRLLLEAWRARCDAYAGRLLREASVSGVAPGF